MKSSHTRKEGTKVDTQEKYFVKHNTKYYILDAHTHEIKKKIKAILIDVTILFIF